MTADVPITAMFESLVNSVGSKTRYGVLALDERFESLVNSVGSKTAG